MNLSQYFFMFTMTHKMQTVSELFWYKNLELLQLCLNEISPLCSCSCCFYVNWKKENFDALKQIIVILIKVSNIINECKTGIIDATMCPVRQEKYNIT